MLEYNDPQTVTLNLQVMFKKTSMSVLSGLKTQGKPIIFKPDNTRLRIFLSTLKSILLIN